MCVFACLQRIPLCCRHSVRFSQWGRKARGQTGKRGLYSKSFLTPPLLVSSIVLHSIPPLAISSASAWRPFLRVFPEGDTAVWPVLGQKAEGECAWWLLRLAPCSSAVPLLLLLQSLQPLAPRSLSQQASMKPTPQAHCSFRGLHLLPPFCCLCCLCTDRCC